MAKRKSTNRFGSDLVQAAKEMLAHERGELRNVRTSRHAITVRQSSAEAAPRFSKEEIIRVRKSYNFSQAVFASALNVKPATVRAWEQGQREPDGASSRLLQIVRDSPATLLQYMAPSATSGVAQGNQSKPAKRAVPAKQYRLHRQGSSA
ncbi:MAG: helix-turn-helix domain-containing protein [Gemmatimonadaceae bacterium]